MEANDAPEKIYLQENTITYCNGEWLPAEWSKTMVKDTDIKYIRADVFVEKACEFLKSYRQDTYDGTGYIAGIVNDKTIQDFRNYMKGE